MVKGHLEVVKLLQSKGAQLNSENLQKTCLLNLAAESGNADLLKYMLDAGVSQTTGLEPDKTALLIASKAGHERCVKVYTACLRLPCNGVIKRLQPSVYFSIVRISTMVTMQHTTKHVKYNFIIITKCVFA